MMSLRNFCQKSITLCCRYRPRILLHCQNGDVRNNRIKSRIEIKGYSFQSKKSYHSCASLNCKWKLNGHKDKYCLLKMPESQTHEGWCLAHLTDSSIIIPKRFCATVKSEKHSDPEYMVTTTEKVKEVLGSDMLVINDFITEEEEELLFQEVETHLKRLRYETSHWDDAIHGYRETQRIQWREKNKPVIQRIRDTAFLPGTTHLPHVHILDIKKEGFIKPHVDAVKFCGSTIAGISLLSSSIMRLVHCEDKTLAADVLLKQRSLYIMKDEARYKFTHEILKDEESVFNGKRVPRDRRISLICRSEP